MNVQEQINAVLNGHRPERVPFVPYATTVPRGAFGREMRNRGMGLLDWQTRCISGGTPHVRTEHWSEGAISYVLYRTPVGNLCTAFRTDMGRTAYVSLGSIQCEWMIKDVADFEAAIFIIDDTDYSVDTRPFIAAERDLETDGLVVGDAWFAPYESSAGYFRLEDWALAQHDHPEHFARLLRALERQLERLMQLLPATPGRLGWAASISGNYGPQQYEQHMLPFHREYIPELEAAGKLCSVHAHASNLSCYADLIRQSGFHVVEAFTPPPVGDLSLADARAAWGPDTVIWVNLPETIFLLGREQTYEYVADLLKADARSGRLVLGLTEMGPWGALDDDTDHLFKEGMRAVMDAIDDYAVC